MDGTLMASGNQLSLGGLSVSATLDWSGLTSGLNSARQLCSDFESQHGTLSVKVSVNTLGASQQLSQLAASIEAAPPIQLKAALDVRGLQSQLQQAGQQAASAFQQALSAGGSGATSGASIDGAYRELFHNTVSRLQMGGAGFGGAQGEALGGAGHGIEEHLGALMRRMIYHAAVFETVRAPISHVFEEIAARQSMEQLMFSGGGTTSQMREGTLKTLDADTSGLWRYLMPDEFSQARELRRGAAAEEMMQGRLSSRQTIDINRLQSQSASAAGFGNMEESRKLERDEKHQEALNRATETSREQSEKYNATGKRIDARAAYEERVKSIVAPMGALPLPTQNADLAAAKTEYDTKLKQIANDERAFTDQQKSAVDAADKIRAAAEKEDVSRMAVMDAASQAKIRETGLAAAGTLSVASGGGPAAELSRYSEQLANRVKDLRDLKEVTKDTAEAQRLLNQANAEEAANPKLIEAKRIELANRREDIDLALRAKSEGLDVRDLEMGGDSSGAIRAGAQAQAGQTAREALAKYRRGELNLRQLGGELFGAMRIAGQGELSAQQHENLVSGSINAMDLRSSALSAEMQLDPRGAAMLNLQAELEPLQQKMKTLKPGSGEALEVEAQIRNVEARKRLAEFRFGRQDQETGIGSDASIASSRHIERDEPRAAQAAEALGAAKLAIAHAIDAGETGATLAKTIEAQQEHLKALRHQLVDPRGGEFALTAHQGGLAGAATLIAQSRLGMHGHDLQDAAGQLSGAAIHNIASGTGVVAGKLFAPAAGLVGHGAAGVAAHADTVQMFDLKKILGLLEKIATSLHRSKPVHYPL